MLIDLEPEKVTSTCPQRFAELDLDCFGRVLGAGESFRGGAEACWLSPTWPWPWRLSCAVRVREAELHCARRTGRVRRSCRRCCGVTVVVLDDYCAFTASSLV